VGFLITGAKKRIAPTLAMPRRFFWLLNSFLGTIKQKLFYFVQQKYTTPRKERLVKSTTLLDLDSIQTLENVRRRELFRIKDNIIHDKKAEICALREERDRFLEVIKMMIRGINNMSLPSYGPFVDKL